MVPRAPRAPPRSQYQYHIPIRAVALPWATATSQTSILFPPSHPVEESKIWSLNISDSLHRRPWSLRLLDSFFHTLFCKETKGENVEVSLSESESLLPWWTTMSGQLFPEISHYLSLSIQFHWFSQLYWPNNLPLSQPGGLVGKSICYPAWQPGSHTVEGKRWPPAPHTK